MSTLKEELQSRLDRNKRRRAPERVLPEIIDPELLSIEIDKLTPGQRWVVRAVHGLTGNAPITVEQYALAQGDKTAKSADIMYNAGMNTLAHEVWVTTRPKPPTAEPAEDARLDDQVADTVQQTSHTPSSKGYTW